MMTIVGVVDRLSVAKTLGLADRLFVVMIVVLVGRLPMVTALWMVDILSELGIVGLVGRSSGDDYGLLVDCLW